MSDLAGFATPQALAQEAVRRATANDLAGAEPLFLRLTELMPQAAQAWAGLGRCRVGLQRASDAIEPLRRAAELRPDDAAAAIHHAGALALAGRPSEALTVLERAATSWPDNATIAFNRGRALQALGRREQARAAYDEALDRDPRLLPALSARAALMADAGDRFGALTDLDMALTQRPSDRQLRLRRATLALALGDWLGGLADHELRLDSAPASDLWRPALPLWRGEAIEQRHVLLFAEACNESRAVADTLQLARFLPLVAARARAVTLEIPDALQSWFSRLELPANVSVVARGSAVDPDALAVALLSLPHLFEADPSALPVALPAPAAARRTAGGRLRIGVAAATELATRSVPIEALARLAGDGRTIVSLQPISESPAWLSQATPIPPGDVLQMQATLAQLDLVVAADNWIAHLAGTMAVPLAILLDAAADWRWLEARSDTPWYPGASLYRQTTAGDWQAPIAALAQAHAI